jgi:hypothetical protein
MNLPIEPFRPARLTVKRASSWWPFSVVPVLIDGRRFGYLAPGKAKTFRLSGGDRVVTIDFGSTRADLPIRLAEADEITLVCGERPVTLPRVAREITCYGVRLVSFLVVGLVSLVVGRLSAAVLISLRYPIDILLSRVGDYVGGGPLAARLIYLVTSQPVAFFFGVWVCCMAARYLGRHLFKRYPELADVSCNAPYLMREEDFRFAKKATDAFRFEEI